jgi:hypothetical protein
MRRILLVLTAAALVAAMLVFSGVAYAEPTNCISNSVANTEGGGNAEPGETGDRSRTFAERNQELFGAGTAFAAQIDAECGSGGDSGPPGAFDPQTN